MGNGESFFSLKRLKDKLYGNKEVRILMCGEFTTIGDCVEFVQLAVGVGLSFSVIMCYLLFPFRAGRSGEDNCPLQTEVGGGGHHHPNHW